MFLAWLHIEAVTAHARPIISEVTEFPTGDGGVAYKFSDGSIRSAYQWERVCLTRQEAVDYCVAGMAEAAERLLAQAKAFAEQEAPPCAATT